jgi:2-keto-4-pentenoate hydratase/2-oxohepta-3-ene-1,7-dioic acid hydratase in catechol pathway
MATAVRPTTKETTDGSQKCAFDNRRDGDGAVTGCATTSTADTGSRNHILGGPADASDRGSSEMFPVRRIYCIGRNYAAHAREMGSDPEPRAAVLLPKAERCGAVRRARTTADHPYPPLTKNYHYEIELVAALKSGGRTSRTPTALALVYGYAIGLDMTRRDLQRAMGDEKKPWEIGKSFDRSAPDRTDPSGRDDGSFHRRRDLAEGQWRGQAEREPEPDDLERRRADQQAFAGLRAEGRRHHLQRHAGERRPVVAGDVMEGFIAGLPALNVRVV